METNHCRICGLKMPKEINSGTCSAQCERIFIEECTCSKCNEHATCPYAWDYYNTEGDCLANK